MNKTNAQQWVIIVRDSPQTVYQIAEDPSALQTSSARRAKWGSLAHLAKRALYTVCNYYGIPLSVLGSN